MNAEHKDLYYRLFTQVVPMWANGTLERVSPQTDPDVGQTVLPAEAIVWASRAAGDVDWAFEELGGVCATEELRFDLLAVLYWGMSGMLVCLLREIGGDELADSFKSFVVETRQGPYVFSPSEVADESTDE
jgi:hypothetical protein